MATGTLVWPELLTRFLRPPLTYGTDASGNLVATFEPPLTAAEQVVFADIAAIAKSQVGLELSNYQVDVKPFLPALRTFQQMSQSDFIALGQNPRDRMLFDTLTSLIRVTRALLRDA